MLYRTQGNDKTSFSITEMQTELTFSARYDVAFNVVTFVDLMMAWLGTVDANISPADLSAAFGYI